MRELTKATGLSMLLILLLLSGACSEEGASAHRVVRADSSGVQIVINQGPDRILDWGLQQRWTVGGVQDTTLILGQLQSFQIALGPEGHVFLLDVANDQVVVIDQDGEISRRIGRSGAGPGELDRPASISISNGAVAVYDRAKGAVVRWSTGGKVLELWKIPDYLWASKLKTSEAGASYVARDASQPGGEPLRLVHWDGEASKTVTSFLAAPANPGSYPSCPAFRVGARPVFAQELNWTSHGPLTAYNKTTGYQIDIVEDGRKVRVVRRDIPAISLSSELALVELEFMPAFEDGLKIPGLGCSIPAAEILEARGHGEFLPLIVDFFYGPERSLWVVRNVPGEPKHTTDIFSGTGEYVGTLPNEWPVPVAVRGSTLISTSVDSLGVPVVAAYQIAPR